MSTSSNGQLLIVDDEPTNLEILVDIFEEDYDIIVAMDGMQALELARSARPDLVLLDVMMPGLNGYEVCIRLKQDPETADIPVIFVTGLGEEQAETQGLDAGAVDYVTKPINPRIVRRRVANHVELKKARDRLAQTAITDVLTGLANRRRFDQILDVETARLSRVAGGCLSLIMLDVDHFKKFNDTYGHVAGDSCLRAVGEVLQGTVRRAADLAARYGGEEFACILPGTSLAGAVAMAERIRSNVAGLNIAHEASSTAPFVTISLGVAVVTSDTDERAIATLVAAADSMLYQAKSTGRNRVGAAP